MPKGDNIWKELNERQQQYMRIIYLTDQLQESNAKGIMRMERRSIPADRWRWMEYADLYVGHTRFKQRFIDAQLVDQGTGSTFEALKERELILIKYDGAIWIRLTTRGRALVRNVLKGENGNHA
jgi:hypothetical protein